MTTPVSETIYASRDAIRDQVIEFLQQYMELNDVDLTQSSFLSYIIDILTTLTSNLMFYQSNIYREFFLTQAQLPESIHNLSSFLGYSPVEAQYAVAAVLVKIPLPFNDPDTSFNIPDGFEFKTPEGITFVTYYDITVTITNNTSANITAVQDGKVFDLPYTIDTTSADQLFQFMLPVYQYKTSVQEFQLDDDLQPFQFSDITIPVDGKVASIDIYVRDPDASTEDSGRLYTQFNSLYLMSSSDYGYVLRVAPEGRKVYFGNGIIGQQPLAGSTIIAHINETEGTDGNVIAGSITSGARIYTQQNGVTEIVDYTVINPSPAYRGKDGEDLQEIRSNSIKSLVSLNRLVSEQDYKNFDVVIPDAPIKPNSIPVLKRSDLKVNEIQLFTIFEFGDDMVPARNMTYTDTTGTSYIKRDLIITDDDGIDYITLFEMTIDRQNETAFYHYIMRDIQVVPTLIESWSDEQQDPYNFTVNYLDISADSTSTEAVFELTYYSTEPDIVNLECEMKIVSTDDTYTMTNVPGVDGGKFVYIFSNYLEIPEGEETFYFTFSNPTTLIYQPLIGQYSTSFTFRRNLKSYMMSNAFVDGTNTIIYDIPVVLRSYYDSINKVDFENQVLQNFINVAEFKDYRMLTDFINIKLCNTTGKSRNMLKNLPTKDSVQDINISTIPPTPLLGDRYIVGGHEGGTWEGHRDEIVTCTDDITVTWAFTKPTDSDIVYVVDKGSNYIYTEYGWYPPIYDIPIIVTMEVFKINDSSIGETDLINNIKSTLIDYYEPSFGHKIDIRRSKIIDLVHNVNGVSHCRLIEPKSNIFFDFNIDDFEQQELLEYTPEWMHFTEDSIVVKLFNLE